MHQSSPQRGRKKKKPKRVLQEEKTNQKGISLIVVLEKRSYSPGERLKFSVKVKNDDNKNLRELTIFMEMAVISSGDVERSSVYPKEALYGKKAQDTSRVDNDAFGNGKTVLNNFKIRLPTWLTNTKAGEVEYALVFALTYKDGFLSKGALNLRIPITINDNKRVLLGSAGNYATRSQDCM